MINLCCKLYIGFISKMSQLLASSVDEMGLPLYDAQFYDGVNHSEHFGRRTNCKNPSGRRQYHMKEVDHVDIDHTWAVGMADNR